MPGSCGAGLALNSRRAAIQDVAPRGETAVRKKAARRWLRARDIVAAQATSRGAGAREAPPLFCFAPPPTPRQSAPPKEPTGTNKNPLMPSL